MERYDPTGSRIAKKVNYLSPVSRHYSLLAKLTKDFFLHGLRLRTQTVKAHSEKLISTKDIVYIDFLLKLLEGYERSLVDDFQVSKLTVAGKMSLEIVFGNER